MAVVLALVAAVAYGLSDFLGGLLSRHASAWSVALLANLSSAVCVTVFAVFVPGSPEPIDFVWAVVAGTGVGAGGGFLYRGLSSGRMGVVAPVSALGATLIPLAVGAVAGERFSALVWAGIVAALPGIWLVASLPAHDQGNEEGETPPAPHGLADGLVDGLLAGLGFGVFFAGVGQVPESAGLWPLAVAQAVSVPSVVLLAIALGAAWVPREGAVRWAPAAGAMAALATGAFLLATQQGYLTISSVLASLYPATTVLLAALLLREGVHRAQGVGLGLCAVAVALVAVG